MENSACYTVTVLSRRTALFHEKWPFLAVFLKWNNIGGVEKLFLEMNGINLGHFYGWLLYIAGQKVKLLAKNR
jgi:hypothetical protein